MPLRMPTRLRALLVAAVLVGTSHCGLSSGSSVTSGMDGGNAPVLADGAGDDPSPFGDDAGDAGGNAPPGPSGDDAGDTGPLMRNTCPGRVPATHRTQPSV